LQWTNRFTREQIAVNISVGLQTVTVIPAYYYFTAICNFITNGSEISYCYDFFIKYPSS
jgi:hypothetical protein